MDNTNLLIGVVGGIVVSQLLSLANKAYSRLIKSDEQRTEMVQKELENNRNKIKEIEETAAKKMHEEIKSSEMKIEMSVKSINNKMASMLAVFMATTSAQSGTYRTAIGLAEKDGIVLREKLENVNNDVIARYKQFIEDIEAREEQAREPLRFDNTVLNVRAGGDHLLNNYLRGELAPGNEPELNLNQEIF